MDSRSSTRAFNIVLLCLFFMFIGGYEQNFRNSTQQDVDHHALIVAPSVWTLFTPVTEQYLSLSVRNNQYQQLQITALGDSELFSYHHELNGIERALQTIGLIRVNSFQAPIMYRERQIGLLKVEAYNKNIYVYFYAAVLLSLIALVYRERKKLQIRVADKTAELAENNLKLKAEIEERIRSEQTFHSLFDHSFQFIALLDPDCRIKKVNQTALAYHQLRLTEVVDKYFWDTPWWENSEKHISHLKNAYAEALQGETARFEIHSHAGKDDYFDITLKPVFDDDQQIIFIIAEGRDISALRRTEKELQQAQKMESIGVLAGGIAHDFNNILGGILGTLSLLKLKRDKGLPLPEEKLFQHLDAINDTALRARDMVNQLLALSRKYKLEFAPINLRSVLENVCQICTTSFDKSIVINTTLLQRIPVQADANSLEQVFLNICINASHAMTIMRPTGERWGGTLSIETSKAMPTELNEAAEDEYWRISISDSGIGMDSQVKDQLFTPFFTTKQKIGTGLGLSMVYNIIQQHRGFIEVDSQPGQGAIFHVYLPVCSEELCGSFMETEISLETGDGVILIIDDEKLIRENAAELLAECGYQTLVAENGRQGLELYRHHQHEISVVLLDLVMPEMSGKETFKQLKQLNSEIKVLLSSGFRQDSRVDEILAAGAAGFIQKPYALTSLTKAIHRLTQ